MRLYRVETKIITGLRFFYRQEEMFFAIREISRMIIEVLGLLWISRRT